MFARFSPSVTRSRATRLLRRSPLSLVPRDVSPFYGEQTLVRGRFLAKLKKYRSKGDSQPQDPIVSFVGVGVSTTLGRGEPKCSPAGAHIGAPLQELISLNRRGDSRIARFSHSVIF